MKTKREIIEEMEKMAYISAGGNDKPKPPAITKEFIYACNTALNLEKKKQYRRAIAAWRKAFDIFDCCDRSRQYVVNNINKCAKMRLATTGDYSGI